MAQSSSTWKVNAWSCCYLTAIRQASKSGLAVPASKIRVVFIDQGSGYGTAVARVVAYAAQVAGRVSSSIVMKNIRAARGDGVPAPPSFPISSSQWPFCISG